MNSSAQASRNFYVLLTVVVVVAALRLAQEVFVPLALAMLLTFLLAPAVNALQRVGINRTVAVLATVTIATALLAGVLYVVFDQLKDVARELPLYRRQLTHNLQHLTSTFHGSLGRTFNLLQELSNDLRKVAPAPAPTAPVQKVQVVPPPITGFEAVREVFGPLLAPVAMAAVVLVFVVFMLLRFPDLRDRIIRLLGARNLRLATEAIEDAARRVSRYLLMQTLINGWEGVCVAVGLSLIGVPNAILWGALTTVLRFIPYIGIWVALAMPLALSFAVFDRWTQPLLVFALFGAVETRAARACRLWRSSPRRYFGHGSGARRDCSSRFRSRCAWS
jgi:predicted PurR-regulated permease PerM